ncbi:MAG: SusC/RagA family TonB-linked outer membrane protein [Sphingobacterium composti]|uniref:SusC/RagA family TonB-linked outer membrane protein n=1 Tax=Sphingobacterium composti TaxID=363260 RepID=UPI001357B3C1|nr:TonB-dependent receptor [Sphingobacterium composti Ten et al. 2007 non Yoo et al. 2007]
MKEHRFIHNNIFLQILTSLIVLFAFCSTPVFAQGVGKVSGKIVESGTGTAIPDVTILFAESNIKTSSDSNGDFEISIPKSGVLIFRIIGYEEQRLFVKPGEKIEVELSVSDQDIDEVVVVGYGQQKKVSVTAAISTIETKDLKQSAAPNLASALSGRLPGLTTVQTSGQPGNDLVNLYLRGVGTLNDASPLILIDGVPRSNISKMDPNEVESVSILKDASATAAFGVRGANGVILITTRRGQAGKSELNISLDRTYHGFLAKAERLHSWEFAELRNQAFMNDNPTALESDLPFTPYMIEMYRSGEDRVFYPDRDVFHDYFKNWAPQTRLNSNFNGGGDKFTYFLNVGYIGQGGNFKTEPEENLGYDPSYKMDRYNFRGNIDYKIASNLKASLNIATYLERMNTPQTVALFGGNNDNMVANMIAYTWATPPTDVGPLTVDGYGVPAGEVIAQSGQDRNTYGEINRRGYRQEMNNNLNSSFNLDWGMDFITKGLSMKGLVAFDSQGRTVLQGVKALDSYSFRVARDPSQSNSYAPLRTNEDPAIALSKSMETRYYTNYQISLNYSRVFGKHNITGMALMQRDNWDQYGAGLPYNIVGFVGRTTYNYDYRYLAEFNYGYNGSEQFAPANRFGSFPAFSVGWVASNESFLKENPVITNLKIRGSFGLTGNDKLGGSRFLYQSFLNMTGGIFSSLGRGQSVSQGALGNEAIQWEIAKKSNIGVDLELFKSLSLTVDFFQENRDKILISRRTIPVLQGVPLGNIPKVNIGKVDNKGFEAELTYRKSLSPNLSILAKGNFAYNNNTVVFADEVRYGEDYAYQYRSTGFSIGQNFGYEIDYSNGNGYINTQEELDNLVDYQIGGTPRLGDFKYKDITGDGVINDRDLVPIGKPSIPRVSYGLSGAVTYKQFDVSFLISGVGQTHRHTNGWGVTELGLVGFYSGWHRQAWTKERYENGEEILYPALSISEGVNHLANSVFIMNRSFLRLKNIELGYYLPKSLLDPIGVERVRVYINGNNLLTFDKMPIDTVDPEQPGVLAYPITKMFNFGLNVAF